MYYSRRVKSICSITHLIYTPYLLICSDVTPGGLSSYAVFVLTFTILEVTVLHSKCFSEVPFMNVLKKDFSFEFYNLPLLILIAKKI